MINTIRKIVILFSITMIVYLSYEAFIHNTSKNWRNYSEPQLASFASLEQDEAILKELKNQTLFDIHKPMDPAFFIKPNIFQMIQR